MLPTPAWTMLSKIAHICWDTYLHCVQNVLEELVTIASGSGGGGGILGFAKQIMDSAGGKKFKKDDVKKGARFVSLFET